MKKIYIIIIFVLGIMPHVYSKENCKDLPGFKKIGKDSIEYIKCLAEAGKTELKGEGKLKLNTDSRLTDWIKKKLNK